MTKAEKIRIENFKANYNSIKGNIDKANSEHESILKSIEESRGFMVKLDAELLEKRDELNSLITAYKDIENKQNKREDKIIKRENEIDQKEEKSILLIAEKEKKLKTKIASQGLELEEIKQNIKALKEKESILVNSIINAEKNLEVAEGNKKKIDDEISKLQVELKKESDNYDKVSREIKVKTDILLKELKKLKDNTEAEKQKTITAHNSLKERESAVEKRETDNAILVARLRVLYRKFLPSETLKL